MQKVFSINEHLLQGGMESQACLGLYAIIESLEWINRKVDFPEYSRARVPGFSLWLGGVEHSVFPDLLAMRI